MGWLAYTLVMVGSIMTLGNRVMTIISDHGTQFSSQLLCSLQRGLGTKVSLSTAFNSQSDGYAERTSQTLEDILSAYMMTLVVTRSKPETFHDGYLMANRDQRPPPIPNPTNQTYALCQINSKHIIGQCH